MSLQPNTHQGPWFAQNKTALCFFASVILVIVCLFTFLIWSSYDASHREAQITVSNLSDVLSTTIAGTFDRAQSDLRTFIPDITSEDLTRQISEFRRDTIETRMSNHLRAFQAVTNYRIFRSDGQSVFGAGSANPHAVINVSDRVWFQKLRDDHSRNIFISDVVIGKGTLTQTIVLGVPIRDNNGTFIGAANAAIAIDYFQRIIDNLNIGNNGLVAVRRTDDSRLILRRPKSIQHINESLNGKALASTILSGVRSQEGEFVSSIDGFARVFSLRTLNEYPFSVTVAIADDDYLASWRRLAITLAASAIGLATILFALYRRQMQTQRSLSENEERFRSLLETQVDMVVCVDREARLTYVNQSAVRVLGMPYSELIGRNCLHFIHPDDQNETQEKIGSALAPPYPGVRVENRINSSDGTRWFSWEGYAVVERGGARKEVQAVGRDVTNQRLAAEKAEAARMRSDLLLTNASDGVHILEANGRLLTASKSFYRMLGYDEDSPPVLHVWDWDAQWTQDHLTQHVLRDQLQEPQTFLTKHRRNDGSIFDVEIHSQGIDLDGRRVLYASSRDITDRKRAEIILLEARQQAEAANRAKSAFLANMSHEIRTPITSVMGVIDLLKRTDVSEEQAGYLNVLASSTDTLLTVLNDVLDISKIEAGKLSIEATEFVLPEVVDNVYAAAVSMAATKGLAISLEGQEALPRVVVGDPVRLKQVLNNIINNAIKFTEQGSVTVRAAVIGKEMQNDIVRFEIIDTGIGMSSEQASRLFQPFSQADISMTRRFGGTGLGLAISKRLVALMNGEIDVESVVGQGSIFRVTLPFMVVSETLIAPIMEHKSSDKVPPPPLRILLAEDNRINQRLVQIMLQKLGHSVEVAANGKEAVAAVESGSFDAVLMDMQMPEMDGDEATRVIRAMPPPKNRIPIIALTADAMLEQRHSYFKAGVDDLVPKPIDWEDLSAALATATSKGRA